MIDFTSLKTDDQLLQRDGQRVTFLAAWNGRVYTHDGRSIHSYLGDGRCISDQECPADLVSLAPPLVTYPECWVVRGADGSIRAFGTKAEADPYTADSIGPYLIRYLEEVTK